jgi:FAD:protein FMN transferase
VVASASLSALGTTASVIVTKPHAIPLARRLLEDELAAIDRACSRFRPDSELVRVNGAAGRPVAVSELFLDAVEVALRAARLTNGDVDPTVGTALRTIGYDRDFEQLGPDQRQPVCCEPAPGWRTVCVDRGAGTVQLGCAAELDLGATAKALAADRAAKRIKEAIGAGVLVSLGGDLAAAGPPPPGGWHVGVSDNHRASVFAAGPAVSIVAGGLATSSTTVRRWAAGGQPRHHILDPRTGDSAPVVWRTVSVTARTCVDANTATTAAIVRGEGALAWLGGLGLPGRLVRADGEVVLVAGWPEETPA